MSGNVLVKCIAAAITVAPNGAGTANGMLGYIFWAVGIPSARKNYTPTYLLNSCEGEMWISVTQSGIAVPMEPLRQN